MPAVSGPDAEADVDFIEDCLRPSASETAQLRRQPPARSSPHTEIYDYLRCLRACRSALLPETGVPIVRQTTSDIVDQILTLPPRTR